jgi:hypothetical protein
MPILKRKRTSAVEEIAFDPSARQEYLTGFHKRKLHRAALAQEHAKKREREERIEFRKKVCSQFFIKEEIFSGPEIWFMQQKKQAALRKSRLLIWNHFNRFEKTGRMICDGVSRL